MATVPVTVGLRSNDAMTIDDVNGSDPWTVELDGTAPATTVVGDTITMTLVVPDPDVTAIYLITTISGDRSQLTVKDIGAAGGEPPEAVAATTQRAYTGLVNAEADMGNVVGVGDTWEVRLYNDALISEGILTINADVVGATGMIEITVPVGERHDGTAGTGARRQQTGTGKAITLAITTNKPAFVLEWLEIIGITGAANAVTGARISNSKSGMGNCVLRHLLVHGFSVTSGAANARGITIVVPDARIYDCFLYDIDATGSTGKGDAIITSAAGDRLQVLSCTIDNISDRGIRNANSSTDVVVRNCVATNCGTAFLNEDAGGWDPTSSNNATDEATVPGTSGLTLLDPTDLYVRLVSGQEDYHLRPNEDDNDDGSPLTWAGANLSGIFADDIDGETRPATGPWSIGADAGIFPTITGQIQRRTGNVTRVIVQGYLTPPPSTDRPIYHWYRDGIHVAETRSRAYTFLVSDTIQTQIDVLVTTDPDFDPVANAPAAYPATRTVEWLRSLDTDVDHYRVEENVDAGGWTAVARVPRTGEAWTYRWQSDRLADLTDHEFRVIPVDAAGNDGTALALAAEMIVRTPDAPNVTVTFDPTPDTVEFAAV